jgi:hypothetical protein
MAGTSRDVIAQTLQGETKFPFYTAWSYWVFRGKVRGGGVGYH